MASEYRDEVEAMLSARVCDGSIVHCVEAMKLGVKLGLEAAAAAAKGTVISEHELCDDANQAVWRASEAIAALSPTDILKAKGEV